MIFLPSSREGTRREEAVMSGYLTMISSHVGFLILATTRTTLVTSHSFSQVTPHGWRLSSAL